MGDAGRNAKVRYAPRRSTGTFGAVEPRHRRLLRWLADTSRRDGNAPQEIASGVLQALLVELAGGVLMTPFTRGWLVVSAMAVLPTTYAMMRRYRAGAGGFGVRGIPAVVILLVLQVLVTLLALRCGALVQAYGWREALRLFTDAPLSDLSVTRLWPRWILGCVGLGAVLGPVPPRTLFRFTDT